VPDLSPSAPTASEPPAKPNPRGLAAFAAVLGFFLQVLSGLLAPAALALMIPVTALVTGFVLASQIVAEPSHNQIGLLAVYAVFSLALVSILRRKA
jgi:hypothetical protein